MSIRRLTRSAALISLACAGALLFTGCANPLESLLKQGGENAIEGILKEEGIELDLDGEGLSVTTEDGTTLDFGGSASLPANWPGLPVPKGDIIGSHSSGSEIAIMVNTTQSEVDGLVAALEKDGFAVESNTDVGGLTAVQLNKGSTQVIVGTIPSDDESKVTLQYMVSGL